MLECRCCIKHLIKIEERMHILEGMCYMYIKLAYTSMTGSTIKTLTLRVDDT